MKIKLVCQNALASPREITIDQFPITLGRGVNAGVRIDDRWLSRRHCEICRTSSGLALRDLGSTHGTFVNGARVEEACLRTGDELQVGLTYFVVQFAAETRPLHDSAGLDAVSVG